MQLNSVIYDRMELERSVINGSSLKPLKIIRLELKESDNIHLVAVDESGCEYLGETYLFVSADDVREYITQFAEGILSFARDVNIPIKWGEE